VCGKAGLEALHVRGCAVQPTEPWLTPDLITALPRQLRAAQAVFESTGGLHAAALYSRSGELLAIREDVGRHNAVDKLFGWAFLQGRMPLTDHAVLVSGRSSYEIMQKCLAAGVPVVCAVSAPSSLALSLASEFGMTLIGFLRDDRFNIYAGAERFATTAVGV
jgi:FdhD protein